MQLLYNVPAHLESYLEFIPENMIENFLTKAIEKAIEDRAPEEQVDKPETKNIDYSELLDKITEMFSSAKISVPTTPQPEEVTLETPTYTFDVVTADEGNDSVEDRTLIDDFLLDICK